jgi:hypothetical protein
MPRLSHARRAARFEPRHPEVPREVRSPFPLPPSAIPLLRPALTVIEMLIATAITLVMMAAVVNLFANLSDGIRNRRAVIEVSSHLRQVRQRLARDLAGCTVPLAPQGLVPWQRAGEAIGYFEIVEGEQSDDDPSDLLDDDDNDDYPDGIDVGTSIVPGSQLANADNGYNTDARALGDWDDILALTVRSDAEPFVAQVGGNRVQSSLAEVLWYAVETPADDLGTPEDESEGDEPGMRRVYRRVLLIAPWLGPWGQADRPRNVSVHQESQGGNWIANTLADLTRREYRFAHELDYMRDDLFYPHKINFSNLPNTYDLYGGSPRGTAPNLEPEPDSDWWIASEYLMLNDALAFDLRVFDPGAPVFQVAASGTPSASAPVVQPGDAGWDRAFSANPLAYSIVGYGAYVDLGWNNAYAYRAPLTVPQTHFQFEHRVGWHPMLTQDPSISTPNPYNTTTAYYRGMPAVFDTWTWHYENDRIDHDISVERSTSAQAPNRDGPPQVIWPTTPRDLTWRRDILDQGTNGIDDDGINGVDDVMERETSPPYNHPLRGVKVVLRLYERDARQVREASVTHSFVP